MENKLPYMAEFINASRCVVHGILDSTYEFCDAISENNETLPTIET